MDPEPIQRPFGQFGTPDFTRRDDERRCEVQPLGKMTEIDLLAIIHPPTEKTLKGASLPPSCQVPMYAGTILDRTHWSGTTYMWKASGLCHKPLYFEDAHLERHGHSWGPIVQPVMSGANFLLTIPSLPYRMGLHPPNECIYELGHYREGSCAPYMLDPIPLSVRAGLFQAGAMTGMIYAIP